MGVGAIGVLSAIGVGSLASGVASSIQGGISTNKANEANKAINQMNNEFNERMLEKQQQFNRQEAETNRGFITDMWNKTNEYNSPAAARQRLEEAGYNPYMSMPGAGFASMGSSSAATSGTASAAGAAPQVPYQMDFSDIGKSISTGLQVYNDMKNGESNRENLDAKTSQLNIENQYKAREIVAGINNTLQNTRNQKVREILDNQLAAIQPQLYNEELKIKQQTVQNMRATFQGLQIQNAYDNAVLNNYPEQFRMEMAVASSRVALQLAQGQLTRRQATHELYKQFLTTSQTSGVRIQNDIARRSADSLVKQAEYTTEKMFFNRGPENIPFGAGNLGVSLLDDLFGLRPPVR